MGTNAQRIVVVGGTGFVGRHLVSRLAARGHAVRVLTRNRERHRDLLVSPGVELIQGDPNDEAFLTRQFQGCDVAINLVGILNERGSDGAGFRAAHVELPRKVVAACNAAGIKRLLHMSALHADAERGPSLYLRTKGEGEALVHASAATGIAVTSFRPSVIFGPGDSFFLRFATLLRQLPLVFPLACARARFAPVYVGDVASAFVNAIDLRESFGQHYDLCGPRSYSLIELVEYTAHQVRLRRRIIALSDGLSRLQARVMEHLPGKPFSMDNYLSTQVDSVCTGPFPAELGIKPRALEAVAPNYLGRSHPRTHYGQFRRWARRL